MKTQNKNGLIFFLLAFAFLLIVFFSFAPKSSKPNHLAENAQQKTEPTLKPFYGKTDEELAGENAQQKPWEMDWSTAKSTNQSQEQTGWDNGATTPHQQEVQNSNLATASTYSYTKNPSYNYHSYDDSNSDKYVYRTRPVEDTGSRISNDYYQNSDTYSSPRTYYDDYSTSSNSYSAPMPQRQPSTITNCDGAGCWGSDGTRYNRGAGDTYFPSTGGVCQSVGGQMQCN